MLQETLKKAGRSVGLLVVKPASIPSVEVGHNEGRADVQFMVGVLGTGNLATAVDVTVRSGETDGMWKTIEDTGRTDPRAHVVMAEKQKIKKYRAGYEALNLDFVPFVVSSNGFIGRAASPLVSAIADAYALAHFVTKSRAVRVVKRFISLHVLAQVSMNSLSAQQKVLKERRKRDLLLLPLPQPQLGVQDVRA